MGQIVTKELIPGGFDIILDETNKKDYVKKFCEIKMRKEIEPQLQAFLKGFRSVLPKGFVSHFRPAEFELLISGMQNIDIEDMKRYCCYRGFSPNSPLVSWFWEILEEFNQEELAALLFFVSGRLI